MTRILYVTDSLAIGGIETQLTELALRLDRSQFMPYVACLYCLAKRPAHFNLSLTANHIPVHLLNLSLAPQSKVIGFVRLIALIRQLRPDIIQAENYHANLLSRLAHRFTPPHRLIGTVRGVLSAKQLRYERISHHWCEAIVVNAPQLVSMLEQQAHIPRAKIRHIPNGINLTRFAALRDPLARHYAFPKIRRLFLVIGRISAEKNIHRTLEAFALLQYQNRLPPEVCLLIVGPVQEKNAQRSIDRVIEDNPGLGNIVVQREATTRPEDYFKVCDVTIVFSAPAKPPSEGLPSVILESFAAGRPVITSQVANAAGVVIPGVNGWVARDVAHLAQLIDDVISLPDERLRRMQIVCLAHAQPYAVERMVEQYETLYRTV